MVPSFSRALETAEPTLELWSAVVAALTYGGLSRESVLADLTAASEEARASDDERSLAALANVIDCLVGWSSPEYSLEAIGGSEYEVPVAFDDAEIE